MLILLFIKKFKVFMLDQTNVRILELLQNNSQISNQELADQVALSPSPCLRRVKQLQEEGYITRQVALLNPEKLGLNLTVIVMVGLNSHSQDIMDGFKVAIRQLPEVISCSVITGQSADYILKVMVADMHQYQHFCLRRLLSIKGVANVLSSFVLETIIDKTALPLAHV
jgi:Lrp/AsnC family transcriptional regulator, leucine-responsive regulatory protein